MAKAATVPTVKISLRLPENLYDQFMDRAVSHNRDVETELTNHLAATVRHTSTQPIYLDDDDRRVLSELAGYRITNAFELIKWARAMVSMKVAGVDISLDQRLLSRIESRRFGKPLPEHLKQCVLEQLESLVGLR